MVDVSIIVTFKKNKLPFLKECLTQLYNQTTKPSEIIIVEDWVSIDSPPNDPSKILDIISEVEYETKFEIKTRLITLNNYSGKSVQINKGVILSKGEYVGICSADDYYEPNFIKECLKVSSQGDVVWAKYNIIDEKGRLVVPGKQVEWTEGQFLMNSIGYTLKRNMFCCMATWFAKREIFINNQFDIDLKYNEDLEWFLRTVFVSKLKYVFVNKILANYRSCPCQTSKMITTEEIDRNGKYTMNKINKLVGRDIFNLHIKESELLAIISTKPIPPKKYNILNVGYIDCAGVMSKWKCIFDKHSTHTMRNLIEMEGGLQYETDLFPYTPGIRKVIEDTDIFMFHPVICGGEHLDGIIKDGVDSQICGIDWSKYTKGKKVYAFINGSNNLRKNYLKYREILPKLYEKVFVSTPDLLELFPFATYIPAPLCCLKGDKEELIYKNKMLSIYHFPTDPSVKNTKEFEEVCRSIGPKYPLFNHKIIQKFPNKEVLEIKRSIRLCFDHMQGYYGVNSLEAAQVGCVPLVGVTKDNLRIFKDYVGSDDHPFQIVRNEEELKNHIIYYLNHPDELEKDSKFCIQWMKKYWDPKLHLNKFCEVLI